MEGSNRLARVLSEVVAVFEANGTDRQVKTQAETGGEIELG